jgi:lipopolysaccharide export system protein LptA
MALLFAGLLTPLVCRAAPDRAEKVLRDNTVTVTSDRLEVDNKKRVVVFTGNVAATQDFLLCSDELHLSYNDEQEVDRITATGNVRIYQGDKESRSDRAVYDRLARTITITGDPVFKQCADTVRGEKIVLYLDEDKAIVESEGGARVKAVIMPNKKCTEPSGPASLREGTSGKTRCKRARQGL